MRKAAIEALRKSQETNAPVKVTWEVSASLVRAGLADPRKDVQEKGHHVSINDFGRAFLKVQSDKVARTA